ncbi:hypothetical protein [Variovorax sp. PAMC 28711]|uniref:hypothetical protein n=1 Tax=Variovorax sp. PAMC 28711 TaxID=1795631 RepID=UPI00078D5878|nr:hypothetical protein [Variovorax sp. PAMC 28711]AMM23837.1 hypothetical protein AX767_05360 [Variovorax sp. PAMC 28711]
MDDFFWQPQGARLSESAAQALAIPGSRKPQPGLFRRLWSQHIQALVDSDPGEARYAMEMSVEHSPATWAIAMETSPSEWGDALSRCDAVDPLMCRIDWSLPGLVTDGPECGLAGIIEQLDPMRIALDVVDDSPSSASSVDYGRISRAQTESLWLDERDRWRYDWYEERVAHDAELAEELALFQVVADSDPRFEDSCEEWNEFILENGLWLGLEQSCYEGVLLPADQRALRLATCPGAMLSKLRWLFECCPPHVKHRLALKYWVVLRIDRSKRTGNPDWRPERAVHEPPESAFFRPPKVRFRPYSG